MKDKRPIVRIKLSSAVRYNRRQVEVRLPSGRTLYGMAELVGPITLVVVRVALETFSAHSRLGPVAAVRNALKQVKRRHPHLWSDRG